VTLKNARYGGAWAEGDYKNTRIEEQTLKNSGSGKAYGHGNFTLRGGEGKGEKSQEKLISNPLGEGSGPGNRQRGKDSNRDLKEGRGNPVCLQTQLEKVGRKRGKEFMIGKKEKNSDKVICLKGQQPKKSQDHLEHP